MSLTRLTLRHFRNHVATRLEETRDFNILVGENGAGKTNVLEAVSLLAPGRGLRRAQPAEMAGRSGDGGFAVAAELEDGAVTLGTASTEDAPNRRNVRINGAEGPAARLAEWLSITWLTRPWTASSPKARADGAASSIGWCWRARTRPKCRPLRDGVARTEPPAGRSGRSRSAVAGRARESNG
jgi:energy-coupling factor transporter ATP-binding protein EcfA2